MRLESGALSETEFLRKRRAVKPLPRSLRITPAFMCRNELTDAMMEMHSAGEPDSWVVSDEVWAKWQENRKLILAKYGFKNEEEVDRANGVKIEREPVFIPKDLLRFERGLEKARNGETQE